MRRLAKLGTEYCPERLRYYLVIALAALTGCHSYRPVTYTPLAPAKIELGFGSPALTMRAPVSRRARVEAG